MYFPIFYVDHISIKQFSGGVKPPCKCRFDFVQKIQVG